MKTVFFSEPRRLRNGWWIALFLLLVIVSQPIYRLLKGVLEQLGAAELGAPLLSTSLIVLITWLCCRLRREPLSAAGLQLDRRWWQQSAVGFGIGVLSLGLAVVLVCVFGGVRLELDPQRSLNTLFSASLVMLCAAALEELLFRGFVFQRLIDGLGARAALWLFALLFAAGHWDNPGMQGSTQIWATLDLLVAALMLGLAYLRTRSLALPLGLHFGWNWAQGCGLGFGVSGHDNAGWFTPVFSDAPEWLSGGAFGPEASIFAVLVDSIVLFALWRWKGRPAESNSTPAVAAPVTGEVAVEPR